MSVLIKITAIEPSYHNYHFIIEHFYEDAQGSDGHGHASESKERLYITSLQQLVFSERISTHFLIHTHLESPVRVDDFSKQLLTVISF